LGPVDASCGPDCSSRDAFDHRHSFKGKQPKHADPDGEKAELCLCACKHATTLAATSVNARTSVIRGKRLSQRQPYRRAKIVSNKIICPRMVSGNICPSCSTLHWRRLTPMGNADGYQNEVEPVRRAMLIRARWLVPQSSVPSAGSFEHQVVPSGDDSH
jgi:hypothetical protein